MPGAGRMRPVVPRTAPVPQRSRNLPDRKPAAGVTRAPELARFWLVSGSFRCARGLDYWWFCLSESYRHDPAATPSQPEPAPVLPVVPRQAVRRGAYENRRSVRAA
jgi:hypothetical protein